MPTGLRAHVPSDVFLDVGELEGFGVADLTSIGTDSGADNDRPQSARHPPGRARATTTEATPDMPHQAPSALVTSTIGQTAVLTIIAKTMSAYIEPSSAIRETQYRCNFDHCEVDVGANLFQPCKLHQPYDLYQPC